MTSFKSLKFPLSLIVVSLIIRILLINKYNLFVEEAYYWNYAQHLDFGYLDHPPMVALLIKLSTSLFGNNELGVRIGAGFCWLITAYFSFQWCQSIRKDSGMYAIMLLSIMPFFFLHSLVITPDLPLMATWSASLYYLYRALVRNEPLSWYYAGVAIGLGMLSKYSIALLGLATMVYLYRAKSMRFWFKRKEPYLTAVLALLIFSPVIYWNATHEWASFAFQSTQRLKAHIHFSLHVWIGLCILFLAPIGIITTRRLFQKNFSQWGLLDNASKQFMQIFLTTPLLVFAIFSLTHTLKFNWIGPSFLAVIPWLSIGLCESSWIKKSWYTTAIIFLSAYLFIFTCIILGPPKREFAPMLSKNIEWSALVQSINEKASFFSEQFHQPVTIIPLDPYHTSSELAFYQKKLKQQGNISTIFPTEGAHLFGTNSLMYRYWSNKDLLNNHLLMIVTNQINLFQNPIIEEKVTFITPLQAITSYTQGQHWPVGQYYFRLAKIKK